MFFFISHKIYNYLFTHRIYLFSFTDVKFSTADFVFFLLFRVLFYDLNDFPWVFSIFLGAFILLIIWFISWDYYFSRSSLLFSISTVRIFALLIYVVSFFPILTLCRTDWLGYDSLYFLSRDTFWLEYFSILSIYWTYVFSYVLLDTFTYQYTLLRFWAYDDYYCSGNYVVSFSSLLYNGLVYEGYFWLYRIVVSKTLRFGVYNTDLRNLSIIQFLSVKS